MLMLWLGDHSTKVQWTLTVVIVGFWLGFGFSVRERVASPLRTLANLLEGCAKEIYSIRARGTRGGDAMSEVMVQVERHERHSAGAAPGRAGSDHVAQEGDGRDRGFGFRLRTRMHRLRLLNKAAEAS